MELSLNEVETLAARAARGAGYSWGEADETGRAARWLARAGFDWSRLLRRVLETETSLARPHAVNGRLAAAGRVSPVAVGCWLMDEAGTRPERELQERELQERESPALDLPALDLPDVAFPLLVLPFAARAARFAGRGVRVAAGASAWLLTAGGELAGVEGAPAQEGAPEAAALRVSWAEDAGRPALPIHVRAAAGEVEIAALQAFALRTYVPESERSRRRGAGGTDED